MGEQYLLQEWSHPGWKGDEAEVVSLKAQGNSEDTILLGKLGSSKEGTGP